MSRKQYISGIPIGSYLDDVREFTRQPPKYISRWGRADSIYNWIGSVIRLKRRHWRGDKPIPYGIVIEVGPASWLVALWTDGTDPREHIAPRDIDRWWPRHIHDLKRDMIARKTHRRAVTRFVAKARLSQPYSRLMKTIKVVVTATLELPDSAAVADFVFR